MSVEVRFAIPDGALMEKCRGCGEGIFWIVTKNGRRMPVNPDGVSHFATCERAGQFRRRNAS